MSKTNKQGSGKIVITKTDKADNNTKLSGVEFALTDKDNVQVRTGITDVNGILTFDNLPYGKYTLTEIKAHDDYVIDEDPIEITLDSDIDGLEVPKTVTNSKKDRTAKLIKNNENETQKLKGAIFEFKKENNGFYEEVTGIDIGDLTTDENGEINLKDLAVGSYQLIETKAPSGYRLDKTPVEFEILENQTETIVVKKTNLRVSGGGNPTEPEKPSSGGGGGGGGSNPNPKPEPEKPEPEVPEVPETPEPEKPTDPIKEETPKDTPKEGEVEVPKESTVKPTTPPKNGTVTIDANGKWTYTPNPGFVGKDSFVLTITHPDGTTEEVLVEIDVDDEVPLGTVDLEESNTNKPDESVKSEAVTSNANRLPKTGEESQRGFYITGLLLVVLGVFLKKRKTA